MANLKKDVLVEGYNWNVAGVNATDKNEVDFVARHMKDKETYKKLNPTQKESALKLAYSLVQENTPKKGS